MEGPDKIKEIGNSKGKDLREMKELTKNRKDWKKWIKNGQTQRQTRRPHWA